MAEGVGMLTVVQPDGNYNVTQESTIENRKETRSKTTKRVREQGSATNNTHNEQDNQGSRRLAEEEGSKTLVPCHPVGAPRDQFD
jgi:hypothetical protein